MSLSFWEIDTWFNNIDFTIVGSGIVGLSTALTLRERFPDAKILVLEKGMLPEGASTKNAGFACFGSLSEIMDDLRTHSEDQVVALVEKRWKGLQMLRKRIGDEALDFKPYGGYEIFLREERNGYEDCLQRIPFVNEVLKPVFKAEIFEKQVDRFGFSGIEEYSIFNPFEAQIDTGRAMGALLQMAQSQGILVLNNIEVIAYHEKADRVLVETAKVAFFTKKLLFATNGFAGPLTNDAVKPARAQVLITKPIDNLDVRGTFHFDQGYYYFRNIGNRILFGGGRNLDFEAEATTHPGLTEIVQQRLETLLKEVILPGTDFEVEHRWSGIMGMGNAKDPIVSQLSEHVYCGVRLGGMGVAIGSLVGSELAELV